MVALLALFFAAFAAATLVPAQSEAVLVALLLEDVHPVGLLLIVATVGNVLGSMVNWVLGRFLVGFSDRPWFPVSHHRLEQASRWYSRYGRWSLLGSWVPVVGDPLTVAAGLMREPFWRFSLIVTLAKGGRYMIVAAGALAWL